MALEGGYDIPAICDATEHTIRALLGDELQPISEEELNRKPCQAAVDTLRKTIDIQVTAADRVECDGREHGDEMGGVGGRGVVS